ncbi:hypothetical protein M91_07243, partial [Bos mutus]
KKKKKSFLSVIFSFSMHNNEPFLHWIVTCDKSTTGNDQLGDWTEKKRHDTSHSQTCIRKRSWPLVVAADLIHCSFLNPRETITSEKYAQQIDEMHRKLQRLQPALVNRKGPILLHDNSRLHLAQPTLQKLNELCYEQLFGGKTLPQPA